MKIFHCEHCGQLVFFENVHCVNCGHRLAYLPDAGTMGALAEAGDGLWRAAANPAQTYRLCRNYAQENVCNWAVPASDAQPLCRSCRLTRIIPNLSEPANRDAWFRLEAAKRRLVYNLLNLNLPLQDRLAAPEAGLAFEFLADPPEGGANVLTGHNEGVITVNLAEADDPAREGRRVSLHEPYRTVLGHFRHESGHYYWDQLIKDRPRQAAFRETFGDDTQNYQEALARHYAQGAPADWPQRFVSAYASSHPWEDWAETWAHYLHMTDTIETAVACGLALKPQRPDEPALESGSAPPTAFQQKIQNWFSLVYVLNNLNRGMGLADAYPFTLSTPAIGKLRFVHETIQNCVQAAAAG